MESKAHPDTPLSYVDALLELSDAIYTVNLTKDVLEKNIVLSGKEQQSKALFMDYPLPCNYHEYCQEYKKNVTQETIAGYCMTDEADKLLKRFENGETHISVEYCVHEEDGSIRWIQKTVLMTQDVVSIIIERAVNAGVEWVYEKNKAEIPYLYVYGSPLHLRQIFLNIYGNCIKYNHPGGKVSTIVEVGDVHDGICTYRWTITDTGEGMSKEFLAHIFEPFSQEKVDARSVYQGTGLGMTIVKALLDQMRGDIQITSEVGVGSTFVITIPFEIAPAPDKQKSQPNHHKADIRGLHLLLAEDNPLNAEIAQMLLSDEGVRVTVVENGQLAVEAIQNYPPGTFDGILMDIMLPSCTRSL